MSYEITQTKKISRTKVFFCALLGYSAFNAVFKLPIFLLYLIIGETFSFFRLFESIAYFVLLGSFKVCSFIGHKLLKIDDAVRRYWFTVGALLVINYSYFLINYIRYKEGSPFEIIIFLIIGLVTLSYNRKD